MGYNLYVAAFYIWGETLADKEVTYLANVYVYLSEKLMCCIFNISFALLTYYIRLKLK